MDLGVRHAGHGHGHGGSHFANVKYGYIILGLSLVYAAYVSVARYLYLRKWNKQARTPTGFLRAAAFGHLAIHVIVWILIFTVLLFMNVHNLSTTYSMVLKRLGRLAYCLVPLDAVLALRPAFLGPHASYLQHLGLHKWLLRLILVAVVAHGIGYSVKWLIEHRFWNRTLAWRNFLGVVPFWMTLVLLVVSLRPVRRKIYGLFYIWHNVTVFAFTGFMLWHARPGVTDILVLAFLLYGIQIFLRIRYTFKLEKVTIFDTEESLLRLVRLQKPPNYPVEWVPGSHLRFSWRLTNWRYWVWPSHPFSICSLPNDSTVDLVVKKGLRFEIFLSLEYSMTSPYSLVPPPLFDTADNVHVICGGSGISLGVPVYRYFKKNSSVLANMTWCVRNASDTFVLSELGISHPVDVFVTKGELSSTMFVNNGSEEDYGLLNSKGDDLELESLNLEETDSTNPFADEFKMLQDVVKFKRGRPLFDEIFSQFRETDEPRNKWIVVCGPSSLINAVKKWGKLHQVQVFEEVYDM